MYEIEIHDTCSNGSCLLYEDYQPCRTGFDVFRSIYDADKTFVKHCTVECDLLYFCMCRMNEKQILYISGCKDD